jgi:enoyl-CoA hydratase/carnithine racemase
LLSSAKVNDNKANLKKQPPRGRGNCIVAALTIDTGTPELLCEIEERVATITLNRPEARNSLSDELTPALRQMVFQMGEDGEVGALIITGTGDAFCSGGNVKDMSSRTPVDTKPLSPEERIEELKEKQRSLTGRIAVLPKPVIASLPGPAAGAGLSIALACDLRFVSENVFVSTAYANIGLSGDYGMTWALTRLIGTGRARELMFSADRITADQGLAMGLFNKVLPSDELKEFTFDYAKKLANGPTAAYAAMKDNLNFALDHDFLDSLDREAENMVRAAGTKDHQRALRSFMEARKK